MPVDGGGLLTRPALQRGGNLDWRTLPTRVMPGAESATGVLPDWVTSTAGLTLAQWNVAQAYWLLFGRAPDSGGLAYWVGQFGGGVTLANAIDGILSSMGGSALLIDPAPSAIVAQVYWVCLGKTVEDDPSGQAYWTGRITETSLTVGQACELIASIVLGTAGWHGDTMRNRLRVLESTVRIQQHYARDLSIADSCSIVMRAEGALPSYQSALDDLYRLIVQQVASVPNSWGAAHTTATFLAACKYRENTATLQHRHLVWYNRNGDMMLCYAVLPSNFVGVSTHPVVCLFHGGAWRLGHPAQPYWYAERIAAMSSAVVLVPTYRLTKYGVQAPAPQQDVADFLALVRGGSSAYLKRDATKVGLMGESAGAHLACLVGAQQDVWRVFGLYPPIDLTGTPSVSSGLAPYVGYYVAPALRASVSPNLQWSSARTTRFELWHGNADAFVPPAQSAAMKATVGANCSVTYRDGQGHGFFGAARTAAASAAVSFFS